MQLTLDDLIAGWQTIAGEARTEPFQGQVAVGAVLFNRLSRRNYFKCDTIWEVCHKSWQFSFWNNALDRNLEIIMNTHLGEPMAITAMRAFLEAAEGTDPSLGADHYHTIQLTPKPNWTRGVTPVVTIKNHVFYRLA